MSRDATVRTTALSRAMPVRARAFGVAAVVVFDVRDTVLESFVSVD